MTVSERVYRVLLVAYPQDHRRVYGEPMVQLFRDRMRRDGGGIGALMVWVVVGFDLLSSAFKERMEAIMAIENWTSRWWEACVVILAVNSAVFGYLFINNDYLAWGIGVGFIPAVLLFTGLAIRRQRVLATLILTVASIAAAFPWWAIYPVVLALVVIIGGFATKKIGPQVSQPGIA